MQPASSACVALALACMRPLQEDSDGLISDGMLAAQILKFEEHLQFAVNSRVAFTEQFAIFSIK